MLRISAGLSCIALVLTQTNAQEWLAKGQQQFTEHDFSAARDSFQKAIEIDGNNFVSYRALGLSELELHHYNAAYRAWIKSWNLNKDDVPTKYYLGRLFYESDLPNEAAVWLRQVVTASPDDYAALTYLGLSAEALGYEDTARGLYRNAIYESNRQNKPYSWAYLALGNLLVKRDEEAQARKVLAEAEERCPEPHLLALLGELLAKAGEKPRAEAVLRRATALDPGLSRAHYRLALLLKSEGKDKASAEEMHRFQQAKAREAALPKPQALRKDSIEDQFKK